MRIGNELDFIDIALGDEHVDGPAIGDVLLSVTVQCGDFSGKAVAWVDQNAWADFMRDMQQLETTRRGEARIEAISPGNISLRFHALDRAGHMAVSGAIGHRTSFKEYLLTFSPIPFDPTALPDIVRGLRSLARKSAA